MSVKTSVSDDGGLVTIHVNGRFDFTLHRDFQRAYQQHPRGETHYVVDLQGAEYLDSAAMGMLLQLRDYAATDRPMELVNGNDGVREVLRIANFDKLFRVA